MKECGGRPDQSEHDYKIRFDSGPLSGATVSLSEYEYQTLMKTGSVKLSDGITISLPKMV